MPCTATPRGLTDPLVSWSDLTDNNPCGNKALQRAGLPDPLVDSPRALWRFDEISGGLAYDAVGGNNGVLSGGITQGAAGVPLLGSSARGVLFDGTGPSGSGITVPQAAALDLADLFTLEAWVSSTGLTAHSGTPQYSIIGKGTAYNLRATATGTLQLIVSGVLVVSSSVSVPLDGSWHHVAVTKSGATTKLYLDGVDVTVAGSNAIGTNNATALVIGNEGTAVARQWQGGIDQVAIYNVALTQAQIQGHALGKDVSADSLCMFHYQMKYGQNVMQQPITVEP